MELMMRRRKSLHWKLEDIMNHLINKLSNKVNIVVILVHHSIQIFYDSIGTCQWTSILNVANYYDNLITLTMVL